MLDAGYIDDAGQNLAPKEVLVTKIHLHQGTHIFFQAWKIKESPDHTYQEVLMLLN